MTRTALLLAVILLAPLMMGHHKSPLTIFRFDLVANGGTIPDPQTDDEVFVMVLFVDGTFEQYYVDMSTVSSSIDLHVPGYWPGEVAWLYVAIGGDDRLWIDQIEVFDPGGTEIWQWGSDSMEGYCLSTDPDDGDPAVCNPDQAEPYHIFPAP